MDLHNNKNLSEQDEYWRQRITSLEQIICDLLRKNHELRSQLSDKPDGGDTRGQDDS